MEAMIANAFGVSAESQTSPEGGKLISATNEFINLFLDRMNNGAEEITVLLCKSLRYTTKTYLFETVLG